MRNKVIDYKWRLLFLVSAAYFLAQGTRHIYAAVLPQIKADLASSNLSDSSFGLVGSTFTMVFGLVMPLAGAFADIFRRKWILVIGCALFSVGIIMSGFATGLGMLLISYGFVNGIGQSLMPPCNSSLIGQLHTDTRGFAFSIYQAAIYLGIILCSVCSGILADLNDDGWRAAFWIFGSLGALWAVVLSFRLKDIPQPQTATSQEKPSMRESLKAFVSKPTAIILMGALGCFFFTTYGFKNWVPMFMMRAFPEMSSSTAVFHAVFWFYIGAFIGVTAAGRMSDKLKAARPTIRLDVEIIGILLCVPFILVMAWAQSLPLMLISVTLFGFATGIYDSNLYAALLEVINPRYRAAATGFFGCGGSIVGALGPATMGILSDTFSLRTAFASLSVFALLGAILVVIARVFTFKKDVVS